MGNQSKQSFILQASNMIIKSRKLNIPIVLLLSILLTTSKSMILHAQEKNGAFIMSSVGVINNFSNNSMALTFSSNSNCLNVQNGAAVLTGDRGNGLFAANCETITKINSLGIQLLPNPVSDFTKVKFMNTPPLYDNFIITILGLDGSRITNISATGYELFQGKQINLSSLSSGTFFIQIESSKYIDAIKFIKVK
jgi:hypothetical protein